MEKNENANNIQNEKNRLHIKYIIAISAIICLGSIILSLSDKDIFVDQVSFASTITSIVLSVIAIWMSISGERTTNDIKSRITESTERLSKTTANVEILNNKNESIMSSQLKELNDVKEKLETIIHSVDNVGEQVTNMQKMVNTTPNAPNTSSKAIMTTDQKIVLFRNAYNWASDVTSDTKDYRAWLFCQMTYILINNRRESKPYNYDETRNYLDAKNVNLKIWNKVIDANWGIINTLIFASVFSNDDAINQILEIIKPNLGPQPATKPETKTQ